MSLAIPVDTRPRHLTITAEAVRVDPRDEHDCRGCGQRLEGPWGRRVHVGNRPAVLTCDSAACIADALVGAELDSPRAVLS